MLAHQIRMIPVEGEEESPAPIHHNNQDEDFTDEESDDEVVLEPRFNYSLVKSEDLQQVRRMCCFGSVGRALDCGS